MRGRDLKRGAVRRGIEPRLTALARVARFAAVCGVEEVVVTEPPAGIFPALCVKRTKRQPLMQGGEPRLRLSSRWWWGWLGQK